MGTGEPVVLKVKKAMEDLYNNTKTTNFLHGSRFLEKFLQEFHKLYIGGDYRFFFMYFYFIYKAHYFYLLCIVSACHLFSAAVYDR